MPKIEITKPELIWPGKYDEDGNRVINRGVALPFQVIETIREGRATREPGRTVDLFSYAKPSEDGDWKNKLIWGDNQLVMTSLMEQFAGKFDLIYIDPPFATGADFSFKTEVGEGGEEIEKAPSAVEEKAYRDTWGAGYGSYLGMISARLVQIHELLKADGSFFLHCDWHASHFLRSVADEVFGPENFLNEIVWYYYKKFQGNINRFASNHDVVFWYRKGEAYQFTPQTEKRSEGKVRQLVRVWDKEKGAIVNAKGPDGKVLYRETDERTVDDVWRISMLQPADKTENRGFPTQKPEALLQRIVQAASIEGDLVGDFFCGSGTTLAVSEKHGRRWVGCDLGRWGIHTTRKRLLDIEGCKPFEVLNLGQYERKYWQGVNFGDQKPAEPDAAAIAAYVRFILDLYRAQPVPGTHIHGRKGGALVHVGAVDAPVTIREVNDAVAECAALKQKELHVLGWEWEMGLHDPLTQSALHEHGVRLRLLNIPREVMEKRAVEAGDIRFFDLAHLEAELEQDAKHPRKVKVKLKNFVIPDTDLIPDEVREKIRKWSDYIDYWAVDWDFKHDTFMNAWQAYRTRQNRKLALVSDTHEYTAAGRYLVLIKVVDIFGNDTSRLLECKVN